MTCSVTSIGRAPEALRPNLASTASAATRVARVRRTRRRAGGRRRRARGHRSQAAAAGRGAAVPAAEVPAVPSRWPRSAPTSATARAANFTRSAAARSSLASATRRPTDVRRRGAGPDEDIQGIPFVGRAGQLLTKIIEAMGFAREDVYIANVINAARRGTGTPSPTRWPPASRSCSGRSTPSPRRHRRARHVCRAGAAADEGADFAAARPRLRLPRRQAGADVPPGVPASEPRPEARRLGGHEERRGDSWSSAAPADRPDLPAQCPAHLGCRPVPGFDLLTYAFPTASTARPGARVLVPLGSACSPASSSAARAAAPRGTRRRSRT